MIDHYITAVATERTQFLIACRCGWSSAAWTTLGGFPLEAAHRAFIRHTKEEQE